MTQISLPSYSELTLSLGDTMFNLHASQAHGVVCGILAANSTMTDWEKIITGGDENGGTRELLHVVYDGSSQQLKDFLFEFQLLLPNEEESLQDRAEALSLWCQGFLTGLKAAGESVEGRGHGEASEAIADMVEVAKMEYEEVVDTEEDETAYLELVEYVRMAVILIYQDLHGQDTSELPTHSSHLH